MTPPPQYCGGGRGEGVSCTLKNVPLSPWDVPEALTSSTEQLPLVVAVSTFMSGLAMAKVRTARASCEDRGGSGGGLGGGQGGLGGIGGFGDPPKGAHLLLAGGGVEDDGAVGGEGAGDAAEEGGEGQPRVQQPQAGRVEAAGEQLFGGGQGKKGGLKGKRGV